MTIEEQLELHEGRKRFAYVDTVGKTTAGVGRNLTDKGLSDDEIDLMLANDIRECVTDLQQYAWFDGLNDVRQRVLIDMRLNLGAKGFRGFKRMLAAVADQDYHKAALAMRQSLWFRQTKSRGVRLAKWMYAGEEV